jgi:two-component system, NtrC family, nitrogen regulation response regulator NtrX
VATHRDLEERAKQGAFRGDLYHRIHVFPIVLPALRERQEDIPALVEHFARQVCAQNGWKPLRFAPEAIEALKQYAWPGNIRELRNVVERLLLLAEAEVDVGAVELALPGAKRAAGDTASSFISHGPLSERVAQFERETVLAELGRNHHHITNTAKALGLERSHLYKKCQQLGIDLRQVE